MYGLFLQRSQLQLLFLTSPTRVTDIFPQESNVTFTCFAPSDKNAPVHDAAQDDDDDVNTLHIFEGTKQLLQGALMSSVQPLKLVLFRGM